MRKMNHPKLMLLLAVFWLTGGYALGQETDTTVRYNQYGARVNRTPLKAEERNGVLVLESKDQKYKIW
ncbi:MAG: hypothetical protein M9901_15325, partial [Lentimicrobium sp.]|nr:hypothetical protein [Lentimicrobium sp.]